MVARRLDRIVHAERAGSSNPDYLALNSWLGDQELKRRVNVDKPLRPVRLSCAFAISATVNSKRVDSRGRELAGERVPILARAVALMKQQNARAGLWRSIESRLQDRAVGAFHIDWSRRRRVAHLGAGRAG